MKTKILLLAVCALALPLASCKVGPDYKAPQPQTPAAFAQAQASAAADAKALAAWWRTFGDERLVGLVEDALKNSPDAKEAAAKVKEARADAEAAGALLWPSIDAKASYERRRDSENLGNPFANQYPNQWSAGLTASWELDVFGGARRALEGVTAQYEAQVERERGVRVALAAEVATQYALLRGLDNRLAIVRGNIAAQEDTLNLADSRFKAGLTTEAPVAQATAQLASLRSRTAPLEQAAAQASHRLSVLVGHAPETGLPAPSPKLAAVADPTAGIPVGLPSELLRRRPDVRAAERDLAAATADVGVATAELFPRFSLTGNFGQASTKLKTLPDAASNTWSVMPSVSFHLFDRSRVKAQLRSADARSEQAAARYEKAVLASLEDAENALVACDRGRAQFHALADAVTANERNVALARELFEKGLGDFLSVLVAQRDLFEVREQLEESRAQQSINAVGLYKALGGGWEEPAKDARAQGKK